MEGPSKSRKGLKKLEKTKKEGMDKEVALRAMMKGLNGKLYAKWTKDGALLRRETREAQDVGTREKYHGNHRRMERKSSCRKFREVYGRTRPTVF